MTDQLTRKRIRKDAQARLVAAGLVPVGHVIGPRTTRIPDDLLPALMVYCRTGNGKNISGNAPTLRWTQELAIECVVTGADDEAMGDALDDLSDAVEVTLLSDPEWVAQFEKAPDVRFEMAFDDTGARRMGAGQVVVSLQHVREYMPDLEGESDLSTVQLRVATLPLGGAAEATATLSLEEP